MADSVAYRRVVPNFRPQYKYAYQKHLRGQGA